MSHISNLLRHIPDLRECRVLDLGAGQGNFLMEAAAEGIRVTGIEYNPAYVESTRKRIQKAGYSIEIRQGRGESLPYEDDSFDFVNASEVIEHVQDPVQVLHETYRVLAPGGAAYVSVPNRYGLKDPHYHLYGVNWLPRGWSDRFISVFGREKAYNDVSAGAQRLSDMHYYRYPSFVHLAEGIGFKTQDIRSERIENEYYGLEKLILKTLYPLLRACYFDSFHLLLRKPTAS